MQPPASPTSFKGEASLLQGVDGRKDGAGDLVGAAQQPVGEGQHLASGVAAQCCKHHGEAHEEEHCVAGDTQGGRIPPGEVEGEGQRDAEREAQRADAAERLRVAASAPPVPGQHESGEADEAERPGSRRVCGGGKRVASWAWITLPASPNPSTMRAVVPMGPMSLPFHCSRCFRRSSMMAMKAMPATDQAVYTTSTSKLALPCVRAKESKVRLSP